MTMNFILPLFWLLGGIIGGLFYDKVIKPKFFRTLVERGFAEILLENSCVNKNLRAHMISMWEMYDRDHS